MTTSSQHLLESPSTPLPYLKLVLASHYSDIQKKIRATTQKNPCKLQISAIWEQLRGRNVITIDAPSSVTIYAPRFWDVRVGIIVSPLHVSGKRHAFESNKLDLKAMFVASNRVASLKPEVSTGFGFVF
jgi:hypothetical protein